MFGISEAMENTRRINAIFSNQPEESRRGEVQGQDSEIVLMKI